MRERSSSTSHHVQRKQLISKWARGKRISPLRVILGSGYDIKLTRISVTRASGTCALYKPGVRLRWGTGDTPVIQTYREQGADTHDAIECFQKVCKTQNAALSTVVPDYQARKRDAAALCLVAASRLLPLPPTRAVLLLHKQQVVAVCAATRFLGCAMFSRRGHCFQSTAWRSTHKQSNNGDEFCVHPSFPVLVLLCLAVLRVECSSNGGTASSQGGDRGLEKPQLACSVRTFVLTKAAYNSNEVHH